MTIDEQANEQALFALLAASFIRAQKLNFRRNGREVLEELTEDAKKIMSLIRSIDDETPNISTSFRVEEVLDGAYEYGVDKLDVLVRLKSTDLVS